MSEDSAIFEASAPVAPTPTTQAIPKWEQNARLRITAGIKKLAKPTLTLKEKDAVEADTRHLVTDILVEVLGYDKYDDLTAEFAVRGEFADYGIRIDKQLEAFVEVKRISTPLSPKHLRQVESYALKEGVKWAILTNAQIWQLYHVLPAQGKQSEVTLIFEVDLLSDSVKPSAKTDLMFLISREGITKGKLDDRLREQNATSPKTLIPILLSPPVIDAVRKAIKAKTKFGVDAKEVKSALQKLLGDFS